jgi:hypothetical protein
LSVGKSYDNTVLNNVWFLKIFARNRKSHLKSFYSFIYITLNYGLRFRSLFFIDRKLIGFSVDVKNRLKSGN